MNAKFSTLWLFATLNYLYCDVVTLMNPDLLKQFLNGRVGGVDISQGFLLGASLLVEIPIAMVLLSRVLKGRANRLANIVAGSIMTVVQLATLFAQMPTLYYVFFSSIEIGCTAYIIWRAATLGHRWSDSFLKIRSHLDGRISSARSRAGGY